MTQTQMQLKILKRFLLAFVIYAVVSLFLVYDEGLRLEKYKSAVKFSPVDIEAVGISIPPGGSVVLSQREFERLLDAMVERSGPSWLWKKGDRMFGSWFWRREFRIERTSREGMRIEGRLASGKIFHNQEYSLGRNYSYPLVWLFLYMEVWG